MLVQGDRYCSWASFAIQIPFCLTSIITVCCAQAQSTGSSWKRLPRAPNSNSMKCTFNSLENIWVKSALDKSPYWSIQIVVGEQIPPSVSTASIKRYGKLCVCLCVLAPRFWVSAETERWHHHPVNSEPAAGSCWEGRGDARVPWPHWKEPETTDPVSTGTIFYFTESLDTPSRTNRYT